MTFMHKAYFLAGLLFAIFYIYFILKNNRLFFSWVEDHWFYKRHFMHKFSSYLYCVGIIFLVLALFDLRGAEKKITGKVSEQKTIILIDSSASMMAEDVRPNRFSKALLLVKHYVRKAVGQKISLIVFSDGQKQIVPFTDDYNLIDARIDSLKNLNLSRGGTGLSQAIAESIQYFQKTSGEVEGNLLIFTDAEETESGFSLKVPKGVSVGVVGIGTSKGAPIPMRNKSGVFLGNKKFNDEVVISKLDDKFLKNLGDTIETYQYWIATSYSLPTEKIIAFFSNIHNLKNSKNDFRIRPVLANYLLIPGILLLGLSFFIGRGKTFVLMSLLLLPLYAFSQLNPSPHSPSAINSMQKEKSPPVKSEKTLKMEEAFAEGVLGDKGKSALAANLLKDDFSKDSASLYEETLEREVTNENKVDHFNHGTALLKSQRIREALRKYNDLLNFLNRNKSDENNKLAGMVKKNIMKALKTNAQSKKGKSKGEKKDQGEDESKGQDKSSEGEKGKEDKDQKKSDNSKPNEGEENDKTEIKNKKQNKKENKDEKSERKKKLPALLKQLLSDDNQLQKKMIDIETTKRKGREKKDW